MQMLVAWVSRGGLSNMLLVLSITFYCHYNTIWGCMCSTCQFQFRSLKGYIYSLCYYHHQIGSIHISHCYNIFRGCVPEMFVTSYPVIYCICIPRKTRILFSLLLHSLWWVQIAGYVMALQIVFVCLYFTPSHYHHCANLSEDIELIKCPSDIKRIISVIHYTIYGAVCFYFTHFPCDDWENIYILSYYHHQIGSMNYDPLFRVRSWNNGMRCMSRSFVYMVSSPTMLTACLELKSENYKIAPWHHSQNRARPVLM